MGKSLTIKQGMELKIPTSKIQDSLFAAFFVNGNDSHLGETFIGITVAEAFDIVEQSNDLAGIVFYNNTGSYFGISRQDFLRLRRRYLSS